MGDAGQEITAEDYLKATGIIKSGGIVALPTETFYGLAVDPFNEDALARLFALKGRDSRKAILVLLENPDLLSRLTWVIPEIYRRLMADFWPGPLTLIFEGREDLPPLLTDERGTIGARWSSHPVACRLAGLAGGVITGTSANLSGQPAAVTAAEVREMFPEGVDFVLDSGLVPGGKGSTIVEWDHEGALKSIRDGIIPLEKILAVSQV